MARKPTDRDGLIRRICERIEVDPLSGCMNWTGAAFPRGYGAMWVSGRNMKVHRIVMLLSGAVLKRGDVVMHICDRPSCCNPAHLLVGSDADNKADKVRKGRQARGVSHGAAKLTEHTARAIYLAGGSDGQIARRFGVSRATVFDIRARRRWRHLHDDTAQQMGGEATK